MKSLVWPFHAEFHKSDCTATWEGMISGQIQYVIATICANVGLNLPVKHVVCVDIPKSFEEMTQWAGQASRDGSGGIFIVYGPKDLCRTPEMLLGSLENLNTYVDASQSRKPLTASQIATCCQYHSKITPGFIDFFNPPQGGCQQSIHCSYYRDDFERPLTCCGTCNLSSRYANEASVKLHVCQGSRPEVGSSAGMSQAGGPKRPKAPPKGGTP